MSASGLRRRGGKAGKEDGEVDETKSSRVVVDSSYGKVNAFDRLVRSIPNPVLIGLALSPLALSLSSWFAEKSAQEKSASHQTPRASEAFSHKIVLISIILSILSYLGTRVLVPKVGERLRPKLSGVDLGKYPQEAAIPQSCGLVSGCCFLAALIMQQAYLPMGVDLLWRHRYDSIMLSVCVSVLLGLADDLVDIRWLHKIIMGTLASLPLAVQYTGPTSILIPKFVRFFIDQNSPLNPLLKTLLDVFPSDDGAVLELNRLYLVYVVALGLFCTNAVNIYAGINGIETGQVLIAAIGVAIMDIWEMAASSPDQPHYLNHLFSLTVMLPFIGTTLGLLTHNWFPAKVFVGDIFPYYAGMTFAATAVLGHYSRSLLLLLIPQVINYLYSCPQLFGAVPCPRHRLPKLDTKTMLLEPSKVAPGDDRDNMTVISLMLRVLGPTSERSLTVACLLLQIACTALGLYARHVLAVSLFG